MDTDKNASAPSGPSLATPLDEKNKKTKPQIPLFKTTIFRTLKAKKISEIPAIFKTQHDKGVLGLVFVVDKSMFRFTATMPADWVGLIYHRGRFLKSVLPNQTIRLTNRNVSYMVNCSRKFISLSIVNFH